MKRLQESHPRATEIVMQKLEFTNRQWTFFIARGDKMAEELRKLTHWTQKYLEVYEDGIVVATWEQEVRQAWRSVLKERIIKRLDNLKTEPILKE